MILNKEPCGNPIPDTPFAQRMQENARRAGIPISGTFELTPRCNFNCRMCYVHLKEDQIAQFGSELPVEEWIRLAEEARDAGMLFLCITGGEPLLYPEFEKFYRAVSEMGVQITLQTNASAISGRILQLFEEFPPAMAKITVYGSDDAVYGQVCGVERGFTRADAGIRALKALGIPVFLVTTVIRQNREDLPNIADYAQQLGCPWIYTAGVQPSVRGAQTDPDAVLREEDYTDFRADVRRMIAAPPRRKDDKPCDYCKGYRTNFTLSWNGQMRFCEYMNEPNIPVSGRPFAEAWWELVDYEDRLRWPEECETCEVREICRMCAGTISARSGSMKKTDHRFCDRFRQLVREERMRG